MHILLIPGFMADASLWDDVVADLGQIGEVSHGDISQASTIEEMARQILDHAPERFVVIGFSMGGYVAREMARLAAGRVEALVLVATSARADTPAQARQKAFAVRNVQPDRFHGLSRGAVLSSLHPSRADDEAMVERVRAMSERVGGAVFLRHASQARAGDLDRLASIRCPTLVVAADRDALRSLDESRELRDGITGATMVVVEESGHMIPIERPVELAALVVPWLRERAAAGAASVSR